jgi:adenine-specific DNA-methyltransferase
MTKKPKLKLTWIGKDKRPRLEPRILLEDASKSYHAKQRASDDDVFDNLLIFGDNLLALKALEQELSGTVKCVFIDPPYNTGSAFEHYDDGLEHSIWLSLIRDRLEILYRLLRDDGSLWITIDDTEAHYLKVVCDEIFGRTNFIANVIWQKRFSPNSTAQFISDSHDHILVYAKERQSWKRRLLPRDQDHDKSYRNPDSDPRGPWTSGDLSARNSYSAGIYPVSTPSDRFIPGPPKGMYWRVSKEKLAELDGDKRIWWGKDGDNVPRLKRFLSEVMDGIVPQTVWLHNEVGNTQEAKKEVMSVVPPDAAVFQTPKPERLIRRIFELATDPGDLILDSSAGSGTAGAVAHKMGRRWIMVELGEHCHTHIIPRLTKVIDGEDPGGITEAVNWKGGGGFRYCRLAPSLLEKDRFGNWVVAKSYNPAMLAEAMCKLMGFTYAPSLEPADYWRHGHSTERDFIYVTTQSLTHDALKKLSEEVGPERTLLICCKAFSAREAAFKNLTLKKIPQAVLTKCEWARDDYNLRVANLPPAPDENADSLDAAPKRNKRATSVIGTADLFAAGEDA